MFERFTEAARTVVVGARAEAAELGHETVGAQHLLLGLLSPDAGVGFEVLQGAGVTLDRAREVVRRHTPGDSLTDDDAESLRTVGIDLEVVLEHLEQSFGADAVPKNQPRRGRMRFSRTAKKALQLALREAIWLKAGAIGSEHVLLGLLRCDDPDVNAVLAELGVAPDDLRTATLRTVGRAA